MTKTEYLYGCKANELIDIRPALCERIDKARTTLRAVVYSDNPDDDQIKAIYKAIIWAENMLKEYDECMNV